MSEPVTHAEIEDVLSSIRRLVSEDGRDSVLAGVPAPARTSPPRLVLTPSLRVADVALDTAKYFAPKDIAAEDAASRQPDTQRDENPVEIETDFNGADLGSLQDAELEVEIYVAEDEVEFSDEVIAEDATVEPSSQSADVVLQSAEPVAEEAEPQAEKAQSENVQPTDAPWHNPDATLFAAAGVADMLADGGAEAADEVKSAVSFAEKIAALEAVIGQAEGEWEPDGESGEDFSGTAVETLAWEDLEEETIEAPDVDTADDVVEASPQAAARPEYDPPEIELPEVDALDAGRVAEQAVADEVLGGISADETIMDEESLRELVADIVREELQGALGERITRNVRKLVRREIHRALAVQDLG
ncbi:hypothetical protein A9Q94_13955 [Rhodobacterales bacterium 56_14_T64]|nr:hypothetical protein A9Q94_13955 [Rhodobacterales bacterium 56_14_T64]